MRPPWQRMHSTQNLQWPVFMRFERKFFPLMLITKTAILERCPVTAEAAGSSPVVPAILFKHLQP
jgi:hypothetical protein